MEGVHFSVGSDPFFSGPIMILIFIKRDSSYGDVMTVGQLFLLNSLMETVKAVGTLNNFLALFKLHVCLL